MNSSKAICERWNVPADTSHNSKDNCLPLNSSHVSISLSHRHTQDFSVSSSIPTKNFQSTPKRLWSDIRASNVMRFRRMFSPSPTLHTDPCFKVSFTLLLVTFKLLLSCCKRNLSNCQTNMCCFDEAARNFDTFWRFLCTSIAKKSSPNPACLFSFHQDRKHVVCCGID